MNLTNIKVNGSKGVRRDGKSITIRKNIRLDIGYIIDTVLPSNLELSLWILKSIRSNTIWILSGRDKMVFHGLKFIQDKIIPA